MRILDIDPGLRTTGFGVIESEGNQLQYVASGTIKTDAVDIGQLPARLKIIFDGVREVTTRYEPTCAAIEIVFVNVNPQSTLLLGQARGAALTALVFNDLPVSEYTAILLANPPMLRATMGLDDLFLVLYTTVFVLLGIRFPDPRVRVATVLLVALGLLDMVENFHFLAMLTQAEQGIPIGATQIEIQVVESLFKFHVSYLGLFLLGLGLPRDTPAERLLSNLTIYVQLPVGILIYVTPESVAVPLVFVRFAYFVVSLGLVGWAFGPRAR